MMNNKRRYKNDNLFNAESNINMDFLMSPADETLNQKRRRLNRRANKITTGESHKYTEKLERLMKAFSDE